MVVVVAVVRSGATLLPPDYNGWKPLLQHCEALHLKLLRSGEGSGSPCSLGVVAAAVAVATVISSIFEERNFIIGTPFIIDTPKIVVLELRLLSIACSIGGPGWSGGIL